MLVVDAQAADFSACAGDPLARPCAKRRERQTGSSCALAGQRRLPRSITSRAGMEDLVLLADEIIAVRRQWGDVYRAPGWIR
ncbi:hypothetical protein BFF94_025145 [Burkholderia catarinensis]|nr:hypothetical protein BFF94_025145 [Burkholderia catarinensis]